MFHRSCRTHSGRLTLIAGCLVTFTLGSVHAFSVFVLPLESFYSVGRSSVSFVYSLALLSLTIMVFFGHRFYGRCSPPNLTALACIVAGLGLLIAYCLYQKIKGKQVFQMILLFPYITPAVMGGAVFFLIFGKAENSLLNNFIGFFGYDPQLWLFDKRKLSEILFGIKIEGFFAGPSLALTTSIFYGVWSYTGYYAIILLAGLSIIPSDLYEAAKAEGATRWQTFTKITVPLLMPIIFFLLLTGFINSFQAFNHILVMKTSSAGETMDVVTIEIFDHFWDRVKFGYAAAEGVVLFIILNVLAISQYVIFRKRLNYD